MPPRPCGGASVKRAVRVLVQGKRGHERRSISRSLAGAGRPTRSLLPVRAPRVDLLSRQRPKAASRTPYRLTTCPA
jgi:hypothetical protein